MREAVVGDSWAGSPCTTTLATPIAQCLTAVIVTIMVKITAHTLGLIVSSREGSHSAK